MKIDFTPADFNVALATSVVVYGFSGDELLTLIAQKDGEPFHGAHILPTAIIRPDQAPENVVKSLLRDLTGRDDWPLEQLNSFANPYRNPSGRVVNIAYYCLVRLSELHRESTVFTLDSDFRIYRRHGNKVIPVLMPEK